MTAFCAGPCRNLMTPPKLTGNTPVTDIFHPINISLAETVRDELSLPFLDNAQSFLGQRLHLYKPLGRYNRLHIVMTAVAGAHIMSMVFNLNKITLLFQVSYNCLTGLVAIQALVFTTVFIYNTVIVQNTNNFQIVTQTDFKVVGVMGRSHLYASSTKFHLSIIVRNHRNFLINKRQNDLFANNRGIPFIVGIYAHTRVTQHSFRACSCNNYFTIAVCQRITNVPQMTGLVHVLNLSVRQSGYTVRTPVNNTAALVN